MVGLGAIPGQDRAVLRLRRAFAEGRVAHAYLFTGPPGSGKRAAGLALAAALNCERSPGEGCGACSPCERIAAGIHPDVMTLEPQGAARIIPIEVIRAQVIATLALPPHEGRARVFLIEEALALQGPAQNALLKTLEEPPARTHFVLQTTAPDKLLPTIRSRCQRVAFHRPAGAAVVEAEAGEDAARRVAALAGAILEAADRDDPRSLFAAAAGAARDRDDVVPVLALVAARLHQAAVEAAGAGALDRALALGRRARLALEAETAVVMHNAHGQITFEDLLGRLRRERVPA